ncbi:MAG: radical SAM protein [Bacteroidetes bacterium]|nr:radical SAM protein [Bacteroidota bacterium]
MNAYKTVIVDCYTDEPSGYGVRPYMGTHQIHLSQALEYLKIPHTYLTIEDLRYSSGNFKSDGSNTNLHILNRTRNAENAKEILQAADTIYLIMGCFVNYQYFSSVPPESDEVYEYLKDTQAKKILFYVMGTKDGISDEFQKSKLKPILTEYEHGNTYRYVLEKAAATDISLDKVTDLLKPNYGLLAKISECDAPIINQLRYPIIAEIETGTGCNTPTCTFCIESVRSPKVTYREPEDIIKQVATLYRQGVRHFRLGRQPNFYHFHKQDVSKMEALLYGIRASCPDIETLHVDNVNMINVLSQQGIEITQLIVKYCTSGNITPFGIESFDREVRKQNRVTGTPEEVLRAIEIINKYGQEKGADGNPKLLPGVNLIHNLNGHNEKTHEINLKHLETILNNGWQTQRLYYRNMTRPTGVSFEKNDTSYSNYDQCFKDITDSYVLPMQQKLYLNEPTIIRDMREVVVKGGNSYLRTLGTCPIRVEVQGKELIPYNSYDVKITENLGYRLLRGEVLNA